MEASLEQARQLVGLVDSAACQVSITAGKRAGIPAPAVADLVGRIKLSEAETTTLAVPLAAMGIEIPPEWSLVIAAAMIYAPRWILIQEAIQRDGRAEEKTIDVGSCDGA